MDPYYQDDTVTLWHGDCLDVLRGMPDASVHAVVTDPPYGLGFMGKEWDAFGGAAGITNPAIRAAQQEKWGTKFGASARPAAPAAGEMAAFHSWCESWAAECLRVLKPGGFIASFGGTRTYHRLACAIEDAGFEIRDSIGYGHVERPGLLAWNYGSGFPKSLNVTKALESLPACTCGVAGSGGDVARCEACGGVRGPIPQGLGTALKPAWEPIVLARKPLTGTVAATVLTHGTGALNVDACRVGDELITAHGGGVNGSGRTYGAGAGIPALPAGSNPHAGRWPTNVTLDQHTATELDKQSGETTSESRPRASGSNANPMSWEEPNPDRPRRGHNDSGGASRFFPVFRYEAKAPTSERPRSGQVAHPTVKPLDLMRWLVRLVTPPGGLVLDPFAGSGTTAEACVIEGFRCVTIEREADYLPLITARLSKPIETVLDLGALA